MSVTCGFYNSLNHDRKYDATQMSSIFDGIIKDGVFMSIGTHLTVTAGEGMFVTVGEGKAWFNHTWTLNDAELPLAVEVAELVLDRIDAVVLEVDSSEAVRDNSVKIIKGTPSSEPVNPVMENTETLHQYPLAYIYVKANATEITTSDITNVIGTESTPFITGILETVNIDSLIAQWKSQWNDQIDVNQREYDAWLLAQQTSFVTWREEEESTFEAWFENLRNQLDENQATNLQNQIDRIKDELKVAGGSRVVVTIDDKKGTYNVSGLFVSLTINGMEYSSLVGENKIAIFSGIVETGVAEIECYDSMQDFSANVTLEIPYYGHYEVTTKKVDMYEQWLLTAGYTLDDYPEVSDIVNDYEAMYRMMNLHASVDYWVKWYNVNNTILSNFTTSEVAMKAIGENDYAADVLMAIPSVLDALLASDYWEYILKDKVPVMTSNTEPEGEITASEYFMTHYPFKAFNGVGVSGDYWHTSGNAATNAWLKYKFAKPFTAKRVYLNHFDLVTACESSAVVVIQGSNTGADTEWVNLSKHTRLTNPIQYIDLNNSNSYIYYRMVVISSDYYVNGANYYLINELQFYGRQLHALVPSMTSNDSNRYKITASSYMNENQLPYFAFTDESNSWACANKSMPAYLQIESSSMLNIKAISIQTHRNDTNRFSNYSILVSETDDENLQEIYKGKHENNPNVERVFCDFNAKCVRILFEDSYSGEPGNHNYVIIERIQFYGPDYEETVRPVVQGSFEDWLEAGGYTREQYPTVADVLADEKAVRKLMTVHASCDTFMDWYNKNNSMLAGFTSNRVAMKWIGLRDYIADKLMAIPSALEQLLASEYWEYILKDKVPTMTSNTSPEGVVSASSLYDDPSRFNPYMAFDKNESDTNFWHSNPGVASAYIQYKFTTPICVKKFSLTNRPGIDANSVHAPKTISLLGSNDGSTWNDISGELTNDNGVGKTTWFIVDNNDYYLYYRLNMSSSYTDSLVISELQFYGRSLNESVPVMTSNTAPLGVVSASSVYQNTYAPYNVFGGSSSWYSALNVTLPQHIAYKFIKPIAVRKVCLRNSGAWIPKEFDIEGSNNGSDWVKLGSFTNQNTTERYGATEYFLENDKAFLNYRFVVNTIYKFESGSTEQCVGINELQFYGVSYSEEEFGSDGIEMLYDNGVDVANVEIYQQENAATTKANDYVISKSTGNGSSAGGITVNPAFQSGYKYVIGEYNEKMNKAMVYIEIPSASYSNINVNTNKVTDSDTVTSGKIAYDVSKISNLENLRFIQYGSTDIELAKLRKYYLIKS